MGFRRDFCISIALIVILLAVSGVFIWKQDPYFHYHAPNEGLAYKLSDQRYQNDGIARHFDYDAIVSGSSMAHNFKTTEIDDLFDVKSVKIAFSGGSYKEVGDCLARAIEYNSDIRMIIRCLDTAYILDDKDKMYYTDYPSYLYDDNVFNDASYLFNKTAILDAADNLVRTDKKADPDTFDKFMNFTLSRIFSKEEVLRTHEEKAPVDTPVKFTEKDKKIIDANFEQNILKMARENPQIDFYIFFPPYSILYYYDLTVMNELDYRMDALAYATSLMLKYDNIKVYSFILETDIVCNLDQYTDMMHYGEGMNTTMLNKMHDEDEDTWLTEDNYEEYYEDAKEFFSEYDYDEIFEDDEDEDEDEDND